MGYRIAIVGATGNVGTEMLTILAESDLIVDSVHALASRKSVGREVSYGDQDIKCEDLERFDFTTVDIVLMSAGGDVSKTWSPKIAAAGAIVIDNSSAWRMDPDVPLIVPEVNAHQVMDFKKGIIANPNCSTIQMVVALKPLHDRAKIAYRCLHGRRRHQRRVENEGRDNENPRPIRQSLRDLCPRPDLRWPCREHQCGTRK